MFVKIKKNIFIFCLIFSLILHTIAVVYLHKHFASFNFISSLTQKSHVESIPKLQEEQCLKFLCVSEETTATKTFHKEKIAANTPISLQEKQLTTSNGYEITKENNIKPIHKKSIKYKVAVNGAQEVIKKIEKNISFLETSNISKTPLEKEKQVLNTFDNIVYPKISPLDTPSQQPVAIQKSPVTHTFKPIKSSYNFLLPNITSLQDLNTSSYSNDFDYDIEYVPREDAKGYIFACTFFPKNPLNIQRVKQNFYFIIDVSNSIQAKRLAMTKNAVMAALTSLNREDTFNIITFDNEIDVLFEKNQTPSYKTVTAAKQCLFSHNLASFFYSKNITPALLKMFDNPIKKNEINNIILLSDGEGLNKTINCRFIKNWSEKNARQQSLHVVALSHDKNIGLLDFFTAINKGKLMTATNEKALKRRLVRLIKDLSQPIAKDVNVTLYESNQINLCPNPSRQTNLYLNQPYVMVGSTKNLEDFTVFIQGKNKGFFNVKKDISFKKAHMGTIALKEKWATYRANICYYNYLVDGDRSHLQKAKDILSPYNLTPSLQ